jgi:hypothetical protein
MLNFLNIGNYTQKTVVKCTFTLGVKLLALLIGFHKKQSNSAVTNFS